jgi:hypothetical protein
MMDRAVQLTRLFTEALDARDAEALRALVSDDVQLRTQEGTALSGAGELQHLLDAAVEADVLLVRRGHETTEDGDGVTRVTAPVRVLVHRDELPGSAVFELRDGAVASFWVET